MVKINVSIEGEDLSEIVNEFLNIGIELIKSNRKEIRELLKIFSEEAFGVLFEQKKLNSEINWTYRKEK